MRGLLTEQELGDLLDQARAELFRLEVLDSYDVATDGGDFARYVAGEQGPDMARKGPWLDRLRQDAARGLHNSRVHVVRSPLSDYLRYEMEWGYAPNAAAGEDIRILDLAEVSEPTGLTEHDFWLVDDHQAVVMHYDDAGHFEGASLAPGAELGRYQHAARAAWQAAVPFSRYWAAHPQCQQRAQAGRQR
ncbi:MAG TPA: hypothetical protein VFI65_00415 [Streptosporangiaceae bacterium]|nr:hypothetical protein [Streptosporangiaceae bacterium]